jgi:hypothetical protein
LYGPNTASTPCGRWRSVAAPSPMAVCVHRCGYGRPSPKWRFC